MLYALAVHCAIQLFSIPDENSRKLKRRSKSERRDYTRFRQFARSPSYYFLSRQPSTQSAPAVAGHIFTFWLVSSFLASTRSHTNLWMFAGQNAVWSETLLFFLKPQWHRIYTQQFSATPMSEPGISCYNCTKNRKYPTTKEKSPKTLDTHVSQQ